MGVRKGVLAAAVAASLLVAVVAVPVGAENIKGDQFYVGDTVIAKGDKVKGNVTVRDGDLTVFGIITGDVVQKGPGSVSLYDKGWVKGNIDERGPGEVAVVNKSKVGGYIDERGGGYVLVDSNRKRSVVKGDISERGAGYIWVFGSTVKGSLAELGPGNIRVDAFGLVMGDACEAGRPPGVDIRVDDSSTVEGNLEKC